MATTVLFSALGSASNGVAASKATVAEVVVFFDDRAGGAEINWDKGVVVVGLFDSSNGVLGEKRCKLPYNLKETGFKWLKYRGNFFGLFFLRKTDRIL